MCRVRTHTAHEGESCSWTATVGFSSSSARGENFSDRSANRAWGLAPAARSGVHAFSLSFVQGFVDKSSRAESGSVWQVLVTRFEMRFSMRHDRRFSTSVERRRFRDKTVRKSNSWLDETCSRGFDRSTQERNETKRTNGRTSKVVDESWVRGWRNWPLGKADRCRRGTSVRANMRTCAYARHTCRPQTHHR